MPTPLRPGQWVLFDPPVPGCHVARDGSAVGIYHPARFDSYDQAIPAKVLYVDRDGRCLPHLDADGNLVAQAWLPPESAFNLRPLVDKSDLPPGRVVREGWEPRP